MEHEPITLARQATAVATSDRTEPPAGGLVAATTVPPAARKHPDMPGMQTDLAQPPDMECLGDQIAELSARIDAATYELLCYLREFDRGYGWEGFRSCAHWLNWRTGLALGAAREKLRVATALADLNHVAAAMARGQLSYSKVRALTRVATPATEAYLLAVALGSTAAQVERLVRAWRRADRDASPDAERERLASRALSMQVDEDGMVVLRGRLTPEVGAVLLRAVEAALEQVPASEAGDRDEAGDETTIAQRRADALGLVAESALAGGLDPGNSADRYQVTVHVQAGTLAARTSDGRAQRASADATVHVSAAAREDNRAALPAYVSAETRDSNSTAPEPAAPAQGLVAAYPESRSEVTSAAAPSRDQWAPGRHDAKVANNRSAGSAVRPRLCDGSVPCGGDAESHGSQCARSADRAPSAHASLRHPHELDNHEDRCSGSARRPSPSDQDTFGAAHVSAGTFAVGEPDLDAGQAVIEQVGGLHLGREAARRVACDAGVVVLLHDAGGEVLDVGRRTRAIPSALRRALLSRDHGQCQFPGCESHHCDAHHVEHWADGGETRLTNLVSVCRFHHRAVHEEGFRVVPAEVEGQFRFLRPNGEPLPEEPPAARWQGAPLAPTDERLAAAGISIGPHTATPEWYGEPLNLQAALDVLWEPPAALAGVSP